jgi:hypothetical protein
VLVLQNLGVRRLPIWHYAVVIGFDFERGRVLLRSGTEKRRSEPIRRFLRSWELAGGWGFVASGPAELPATATPARYVRALTGASGVLPPEAADAAYAAAAERWPRDTLVLFATAGRHASNERWDAAADAYETLLEIEPGHAAARNNFAHVRAEQGCPGEALRQAREALSRAAMDSPLHGAILDTVETLETSGAREADPAHCRA